MHEHTTAGTTPSPHRELRKKVVVVDDSRSLRGWLRVVLEQDPRLEVVGEADCAQTARQVIKDTEPDVITLDIEMPGMNGLDFLEKLMHLRPMPVVMISGTTKRNSEATITALGRGAVDCILKPVAAVDADVYRDITRRVFSAACSQVQIRQKPIPPVRIPPNRRSVHAMPLIMIGASTGGVAALERVLSDLHADGPPVIIVQHMPSAFLVSFSQFLNRNLPQDVGIANSTELLRAGQVRLAPAMGQHTEIRRVGKEWKCEFVPNFDDVAHCPSADVLFRSAQRYGKDIIGVILTGLGRDGAEGLSQLHERGAQTIGQDRDSCVVYGMPRAAWEIGAIDNQLPLTEIGDAVNSAVQQHAAISGQGVLQ